MKKKVSFDTKRRCQDEPSTETSDMVKGSDCPVDCSLSLSCNSKWGTNV